MLLLFGVLTALPIILTVRLVEPALVLPALSLVSFVIACVIALFAYCSGVDRRAPGMTPWDIAAFFTLAWIGAGMISGPAQVVGLFEHLMLAP